jgi:glycerophosphoryl diester phosphodiesterase
VGRQVVINVELTNYRTPNDELVEKVIALVMKHQLEEYILFSSFHPVTVLKARRLMPSIQTALLTVPGRAGVIGRSMAGRWMAPDLIHPYFSDVNAKFVRRQHRSGRKVNVWTVNREEDMRRMVQAGVDGLITDDVLMARRVLEEE